jgi:signal transduction histidine kinase
MLESVARTATPTLGQVFVLDVVKDGMAKRLFEFRREPGELLPGPHQLALIREPDVSDQEHCARASVPVPGRAARVGTLSVARRHPGYDSVEIDLLVELASRLGCAIENISVRAELKTTVDACQRLISVAAHELRGSTWCLRTTVQALRSTAESLTPKSQKLVRILEREERRLSRMIDELFNVGRAASGQIDLTIETVDLCAVVREVAQRCAQDDPEALARIETDVPPAAVGQWDRLRIEQIVTNLLTNALKFGEQRPVTVAVRLQPADRRARLQVTDRGPGIDPAIQPFIFDPFRRDRRLGRDGLGLGLYVVHSLVRAMGGEVAVASRPGAGATFTVELPVERPSGAAGPLR